MKPCFATAFPLVDATEADWAVVCARLQALYSPLRKPLSLSFLDDLRFSLRRQELSKGTLLVAYANYADRVHFLSRGSAAAYGGPGRDDPLLWIRRSGDFILPEGLLTRQRSDGAVFIEEDAVCLSLSAERYLSLCGQYDDADKLTILWLLDVKAREQGRHAALAEARTVADKIRWLLGQWDDAFAVFPDGVLASYLGTTREWLNKQKEEGFRLHRSR